MLIRSHKTRIALAFRARRAADWAASARLCGALAAIAGAVLGLLGALDAPAWAKAVPAGIVLLTAFLGLSFLLLERWAAREDGAHRAFEPLPIPIPRSNFNRPMKFVNRTRELRKLDEILERSEHERGSQVVILGGLPGVGKSAVGREWASAVRERFAGGDLLAEFSARRHGGAVDVSSFLADFIRALGPPGVIVPATREERLDRFQKMTADRRVLILLDDVAEASHVSQLRPSGDGSLVIATSYRPLKQLLYDGAEFVPVDPLSPDRAADLLARMAGDLGTAFTDHPEQTRELVGYCGGLALPLCVCATRLMLGRGAQTVVSILAEVVNEQRRLDYLAGEGDYAGAAVFGFAYADLTPDQRLAYRCAGLHPGPELAPVHVAVLCGLSVQEAKDQVNSLTDTYLLSPLPDGRFQFHDLVRTHARECSHREDAEAARESRLGNLVDWYRTCLHAADRALVPDRLRLGPPEPVGAAHVPAFSGREDAFAWLEGERINVLAILQAACDREWDDAVWQMVEALWLFYYNHRHYADWVDATELGIESARRVGHRDAEARLRTQLAWAFAELGHHDRAKAELDQASRIVATSDRLELQGSVREFAGSCLLKAGDHDRALAEFAESRAVAARVGSVRGVALQDYFIGWTLVERGDYAEAVAPLRASLEVMRRLGDQMFIGRGLLRLGQASLGSGERDPAEAPLTEAQGIFEQLGMRIEEAETCDELAALADARKDAEAARTQRERAQAIYRALGHPKAGEPLGGAAVSALDTLVI